MNKRLLSDFVSQKSWAVGVGITNKNTIRYSLGTI